MIRNAVEKRVARPNSLDRARPAYDDTFKASSSMAPGVAPRIRNRQSWHPRLRPGAAIRTCWPFCLFAMLALVGLASARYSGPAAAPANRGTVPPSSYGGSLVSTPSPVDNTNNLVMTGNAAGGKSFRGNVPYGSTTSFGGRLGSTSLDPFLRYSSVPEELAGGPSDYSPFYSPTGTVPKMQPGDSGVFAPGSPRIAVGRMASRPEQPTDVITLPQAPQPQVSAGRTNAWGDTSTQAWQGLRPVPLSTTPEEMRQIVAGAPANPQAGNRPSTQATQPMSAEEYRRQVDQLQRDFDRVKTNASEFEQSLRTDQQPYTPASGQVPTEAMPSLASGESLRRIIQPQSQFQPQPQYAATNPPGGQGLSPGNEGIPQSQGQLIRRVPGSPSPAGGVPQTPGPALGDLDATGPGQTPGQASTGMGELTLVSPQNPLTGPRVGAAPAPRPPAYNRPAAPAPSSSDLTTQKSRIDAIFAPQTQPAPGAAASEGGNSSAKLPSWQRVQDLARAFDMPAAILARSQAGAASGAPSAPTSGGAATQPRLVIAGAPVQSDSDLASAVQDLGAGAALSPTPAQPVGTERALIAVEPAQQTAPTQGAVPLTHPFIPAGSGTTQTVKPQPKSPTPAPLPSGGNPAPKPPRQVLPPDTPFDRHLRSAQLSMQQGQYARAAETFSLAAACNPKDVRPLLGRSHALFAAGEYLSSAVYLAKAIEFDPRYVLQKSDLLESVGGPDVFVQRITDLEKRAKVGDAPMLHLLLAYLYQQMNQSQQATTAIQAARKGLPSSPSADLLGKAIAGKPLN